MPEIGLDLNKDLQILSKMLSVKLAEGTNLSVEADGLHVSAEPGPDGIGGDGYDSYYSAEGIRLGYDSPFLNNKVPRMIACTNIVHRLYDSRDERGEQLINFRPQIDCALIGDMFRVDQGDGTWKYFLITGTNNPPSGVRNGNYISSSIELGVW